MTLLRRNGTLFDSEDYDAAAPGDPGFVEFDATPSGVPTTPGDAMAGTGGDLGAQAGATGTATGSGFAPETVTLAGSGLTFINTYDSTVGSAYRTAILYAEHDLQSHFANAVTIRVNFGYQSLGPNGAAENTFFNTLTVSYAQLKAALTSHATSAADMAAINALPASAPTNATGSSSNDFLISAGLARILGFEGSASSLDDSLVLGTAFTWNYDPNNRNAAGGLDAIGAIEHEITEGGMGRVGGLGYQNSSWGPEDLFRFTASGLRDYTGGQDGITTYFSTNGNSPDLSLPFHSSVNGSGSFDGEDPGDWNVTGDSFGAAAYGTIDGMSNTDLTLMDVLGWTQTQTQTPSAPPSGPSTTMVWLMNGLASSGSTTTQQLGSDYNVVLTGDFNGNGASDVLWRNSNTARTSIWFMNGTQSSGTETTQQLGSNWHIEATGDFNGNGTTDILWRSIDNFHTSIWLMNGAQATGSETSQQLGSDWHVVGTGDFNGDGKTDILWRNNNGTTAIWTMNGMQAVGALTSQQLGSDWQVQGIGDFNGDGRADIVWRNANGQTAIWFMNGNQASGLLTSQQLGLDWHIVGTGDFNGDGRTDVLWRNDNDTMSIWSMNGAQAVGGNTMQQLGLDWRPVATGDFNGDGKSDILFRDDGQTGQFGAGWNNFTQHYDIV